MTLSVVGGRLPSRVGWFTTKYVVAAASTSKMKPFPPRFGIDWFESAIVNPGTVRGAREEASKLKVPRARALADRLSCLGAAAYSEAPQFKTFDITIVDGLITTS